MSGVVACKEQLLPVTALEFCFISDTEVLLAAEGPNLKVLSKNGDLLTQKELLPFQRVHGIRLAPKTIYNHASAALVLVFGQKTFCVAEIQQNGNDVRIVRKSNAAELSDWILDASWLLYQDANCFQVAAVTAHNAVVLYSSTAGEGATYRSEVNCILYSACLLGTSAEDIVVASGTVFNQILLWHLRGELSSSRVRVRMFLSGHEGVIFSIRFSEDQSRIVSVSDDRTIRLWDLPQDWKNIERAEWNACALVLYGHTARVWDAQLLAECIVSIGEDATCRVWSYEGQCLEILEGHQGRSIWSLAVSRDSSAVATGGGDCSIRMFPLRNQRETCEWVVDVKLPQLEGSKPDVPRAVLLCGQNALCLANSGTLYGISTEITASATSEQGWRQLHCDPEFSGYSIMALSQHQLFLAMGNLHGFVRVLTTVTPDCMLQALWKAHEGKVFSLNWTSTIPSTPEHENLLFSCGPEGRVICWRVMEGREGGPPTVLKLACFSLPPSRHRWISAVLVLKKGSTGVSPVMVQKATKLDTNSCPEETHSIICGDRKGSLHVYQSQLSPMPMEVHQQADYPGDKFVEPLFSLRGVHGPNGVTCITFHSESVFTAGRDGYCRQYHLSCDGTLTEVTKFKPVKGMDWIEQLMFTATDLMILGFHTTEMILYSTNQNNHIVKISCGGGHRSYGFSSLEELLLNKRAVVTYIKQAAVCLRVVDLHSYFMRPVLQQAFVGREAVSLCVTHSDSESGAAVVAVGSEDCNICLLLLQSSCDYPSVRVFKTLQGHLSSVRALASSHSCKPGHRLLFSGGARASLKVWSIHENSLTTGKEAEVALQAELYLHGEPNEARKRKSRQRALTSEPPPECRVMALTSCPLWELYCGSQLEDSSAVTTACHYVAAGCSDGVIRQYIYDESTREFSTLQQLTFHNHCLLSLEYFIYTPDSASVEGQEQDCKLETGASIPQDTCIQLERTAFLCSAATDGRVAFWLLNEDIDAWFQSKMAASEGEKSSLTPEGDHEPIAAEPQVGMENRKPAIAGSKLPSPISTLQLHQSGISAIAIASRGGGSYAMATVGDDNALIVTCYRVHVTTSENPLPQIVMECQFLEPSAHSSSITGVKFLDQNALVTTSIDQRINIWQIVNTPSQGSSLKLVSSFTHDVADVSSLELYHTRSGAVVVFCGVGLQYYRIQSKDSLLDTIPPPT